MKKIAFLLAAVIIAACQAPKEYPEVIRIEGGKLHVQGIALDQKEDCMYCSFTSAFFKGSIDVVINYILHLNCVIVKFNLCHPMHQPFSNRFPAVHPFHQDCQSV